ncbi:LOW QUALITY PROTEIN: wall-associated receptor kinase-like 22 [Prosopis cineraria]|uniref:LOW QUALITY PROTEIN: wall-associated receptor kinase-like 22 n=1 Tax=Prosopis cineraria TaxID=364024 RepID=UPI002410683B|nr:LOW QUALITY PROTEIN: wall-associated receptor kinase-like 22 [Prosopis cineraria]
MKFPSFSILLLLSVLSQLLQCWCQQVYLNQTNFDCSGNRSSEGYLCNGLQKSCASFVTFRSRPPFDTPLAIASHLGSEASSIASLNNISNANKIPFNQIVIVPIDCSCLGNIYQHAASYALEAGDTYYSVVNITYQDLAICQMLVRRNNYSADFLLVGAQITVPVLCACPTTNQISDGVSSLLVHTLDNGDSLESASQAYGVDQQTLLTSNLLPSNAIIPPLTPFLVPLNPSSCKLNPHMFYCTCSFSQRYLSNSSYSTLNCDRPQSHRFPLKLVASLGVGIGSSFLCLFLLGYKLHQYQKQKQERVRKEKLFKQNGGLLLQEKMSCNGNSEKAKLFTEEELERATDNYNESRFLGQGGYGTVYKGMLPDGSIVAVKKSKEIVRNQIETFINEVVILSQMNHRNIVKLMGWCLETEAPLLVYEFIPNGTLSHHIHNQELEAKLSWDNRLRIACEVAGALAYMHSAASIPIFHRDIKTPNILLDHNYSAKVSDFGTSRSVPNDRTHLTTVVQGTFGYIDPEYFQSGQFIDKSDVYSFGVVLAELITGRKPITFSEENEGQNLVAEFISLMKKDQIFKILEARCVHEGRKDDLLGIANLAKRCLRLNGKKRPTMREVSAELEVMRKTQNTLKIIERSLEFPHDVRSAQHGTTSESDQDFTGEGMSLFFQKDYRSI